MKVSGIVAAALFMVASTSVFAGVVSQDYSINGYKFNGTVKFFDESKDGIRSESYNEKDIGADLCGGDLQKGQEVVAILPCPVDGNHILDGQDFFLGVYDRDTGNFAECGFAFCYVWNSVWQENNKGDINKADVLMYCEDSDWWFEGSASLSASIVKDKKNESGLDGMNCVKSIRSVSTLGEVDGDPLTRSKSKVNRVKDGTTSSELPF